MDSNDEDTWGNKTESLIPTVNLPVENVLTNPVNQDEMQGFSTPDIQIGKTAGVSEKTTQRLEKVILNSSEESTSLNLTVQKVIEEPNNILPLASGALQETKSLPTLNAANRQNFLPWSSQNRSVAPTGTTNSIDNFLYGDATLRPGEIVMRTLFYSFIQQAEKKIELVMVETYDKSVSKLLQRGENPAFDQLLSALGSVSEHCLPSLLRALIAWHTRQLSDTEIRKLDNASKHSPEMEAQVQRREAAVEFIFCLALLEILKQLPFHPGHEDLIRRIEQLAFRHFKFRDGIQNSPNAHNVHMISDLYAEVVGVLAQTRFQSVKKRFMLDLMELRSKELSPHTTQSTISLLMGMKFFRVKMVPIEEFEASFQFMHECGQYFLEVKDKDIKHALAGLFVEILVPVAAAVKNEVNVPCVKNFVDLLYSPSLDACTKSKHRLALFPLVTCLLCVSQKTFFLTNWHYFLAMCLSNLKNRDQKMSRVALESLYRLLWVYMIRIKCESNQATHSRLQSIVNSLFPRGSKSVVPRDTPLNIFVKIIQFIAQERLDFAMREIVFELLCVGRQIKVITTPERMSIGLRAFLVVADSLQQKDGEPPMPRTVGVLPSGNTLRVKKTFLNKMLTEDTARSIGIHSYFPHVRAVFVDMLRALDIHHGRPLMMTTVQNLNKEPDDMLTGERKPKIDLFRTCVAAIPRLIPETMSSHELVDMLSRLTVHMDEELKALACQSLQTLVMDFSNWRQDIVQGFIHFLARDIPDTFPQLLDNGLRLLLNLLTIWRSAIINNTGSTTKYEQTRIINQPTSVKNPPQNTSTTSSSVSSSCSIMTTTTTIDVKKLDTTATTFYLVEGFALMLLCNCRPFPRKYGYLLLKEVKTLLKTLNICETEPPLIDVIDKCCPEVLEKCYPMLSQKDKADIISAAYIDLHWLTDRNGPMWVVGYVEDSAKSSTLTLCPIQTGTGVQFDAWAACLFGFMERSRLLTQCPSACNQAWPFLCHRVISLYNVIDPTPVSDNRASLLRGSAPTKKPPPESQRDALVHLWKNQLAMTFTLAPPIPNIAVRCASPDISICSSPDSLAIERSEKSEIIATPGLLYKKVVPLLRCEISDIRDAAVNAIGMVNSEALKDIMEEILLYIREAVDRKQENMRRRRRRDALRLQLVKVLEKMADNHIFGNNLNVLDRESPTLPSAIIEYIEGARLYLEAEIDKDSSGMKEVKTRFCDFVQKMIKNFPSDANLLSKELKRNLFQLFASWSGPLAKPLGLMYHTNNSSISVDDESLQFSALKAMCALICCGPCFDVQNLSDDGCIYPWLDLMLSSYNEKIHDLGKNTVILLLEANSDVGQLLEWVIDRCYTSHPQEADACFLALATIFSVREYPCDHYTSVINVTLLMTGCPRAEIHSTAIQLLQVLDKRFFGNVGLLQTEESRDKNKACTLDAILSGVYCRSQIYLSRQMARLRPELTMPMFSEITHRFQTAKSEVRALLVRGLLPWLENMELVATNVPPATPLSYIMYYPNSGTSGRRDGSGSTEATEMILNNLFYITVKFADSHPRETEELWGTLCQFWPNNLKVILRYLVIISGMAPNELLVYAKRVALYMFRSCPDKLLDEIMSELQTVETLNCLIERTETPPFYRLTSMRKASSHSDGATTGNNDSKLQDGTIHTKRHSSEDPAKSGSCKSDSALRTYNTSVYKPPTGDEKVRAASGPPILPRTEDILSEEILANEESTVGATDTVTPHPLPMPEYGGWFAPLTEFLPDCNIPMSGFHRCNLAVMLLVDIIVDGAEGIDWTLNIPSMLHILFLGLDHSRPIVRDHCKALLLHLLIVLCDHNDHLSVARVLLNSDTMKLNLGLSVPLLSILVNNFTEDNPEFDTYLLDPPTVPNNNQATLVQPPATTTTVATTLVPAIITEESVPPQAGPTLSTSHVIKSLIYYLSRSSQPLWNNEDITAKVWSIKSAEQLTSILRYVLKVFIETYPQARINERWAHTALQLGLSCSSRHYAGRSLQIFRALNVPINSRMLSEILSRLIETVAEQGEDMQGYVTELLLTLEAAVDSLDSDFRPLDVMKDIFKSTPNLNKDGSTSIGKRANNEPCSPQTINSMIHQQGHTRSTSYSVSYCTRRLNQSPIDKQAELRNRRVILEAEQQRISGALSRSRSAQSLKQLGDSATQDDKMTILAQLFWLAVSLLESDFDHEYLLALRLLSRVLHRLPLDRPDARDKVEKLQAQIKWGTGFPGVHALLLKGCTNATTYEPSITLLSKFAPLLNLPVCDPTQSYGFPMNVIALLPYMLLHYEDANEVCITSAENIALVASEMGAKLENLGTVMTLYSRKTFSKESFQWTKCVVKYIHDTYAHLGIHMLAFMIDVLEKGWAQVQPQILSVIHCMLHYVDLSTQQAQPIAADLLKVISKFMDSCHWRESLKILKLVVTRSSTLQIVPQYTENMHHNFYGSYSDSEVFCKKELSGRTMDFTFDISQTPLIGRRLLLQKGETSSQHGDRANTSAFNITSLNSPRRSASLSPADTGVSGWKRPWISQGRVRECLVNLLSTCGQRVGLPKSPSVIFSQTSDILERQSSAASSTDEMSGNQNDLSGGSRPDDQPDFAVFKDFDFLEYESESMGGDSTDNFNWGVRRRPLSEGDSEGIVILKNTDESFSENTPVLPKRSKRTSDNADDSSEEEPDIDQSVQRKPYLRPSLFTSHSGHKERYNRRNSVSRSDTSGSSCAGDITPCNESPHLHRLPPFYTPVRDEIWRRNLKDLLVNQPSSDSQDLLNKLYLLIKELTVKSIYIAKESNRYFTGLSTLLGQRILELADLLSSLAEPPKIWYYRTLAFTPRQQETIRYAVLEVQEHLETFFDRKEHVMECLDSLKSCKQALLFDTEYSNDGTSASNSITQSSDPATTELLIALGRSIYKLMFQLLLLIESDHKIAINLIQCLRQNDNLQDHSKNYISVRAAILRSIEEQTEPQSLDTSIEGESTPTPSPSIPMNNEEFESILIELIDTQRWNAAFNHVKQHKQFNSSNSCFTLATGNLETARSIPRCVDIKSVEDLNTIMDIFSQRLVKGRNDVFIISRPEAELNEIHQTLMENLYHISAVLAKVEVNMTQTNTTENCPTTTKDTVDIITTL